MEDLGDFDLISSTFGFCISPEQKAAMSTSLAILKRNYRFTRVVFWGRIKGHQRDYYIAQGFGGDLLTTKKTFVSQSLTKWAQLPDVTEAQRARAKTLHGMLVGDLSYEYMFREEVMPWEPAKPKRLNEDGELEDPSEDEEEEEDVVAAEEDGEGPVDPLGGRFNPVVKRKKRMRKYPLTEEVRLTCIIDRIDEDTLVVPRGAFSIDQADHVSENKLFGGLSATEASNLSFYLHLRRPKVVPKKTLLERYNSNLVFDFLDRLDEDVPKGAWSVQVNHNGSKVTLRSLVWPGYFAFHLPGSKRFGAVYNGTGQSNNADFGFML